MARIGADHPCRDEAELLVSEVVTNALAHSHTGRLTDGAFTLVVCFDEKWVSVAITDDGSSTLPRLCSATSEDESGRGVALIDRLAAWWGISRSAGRTTVAFELAT